jgi:hypothetical protein
MQSCGKIGRHATVAIGVFESPLATVETLPSVRFLSRGDDRDCSIERGRTDLESAWAFPYT